MFTELMPLLRKRGLLITISLVEGDILRSTVLPQKASEADDKAMTTPLAITGTAEELDRDLPQQLIEFVGAHLQLQSTLALPRQIWMPPQRQLARKCGRRPPLHPLWYRQPRPLFRQRPPGRNPRQSRPFSLRRTARMKAALA